MQGPTSSVTQLFSLQSFENSILAVWNLSQAIPWRRIHWGAQYDEELQIESQDGVLQNDVEPLGDRWTHGWKEIGVSQEAFNIMININLTGFDTSG